MEQNIEFNTGTKVFLAERVIRIFSNKLLKVIARLLLIFGTVYLLVFIWNLLDPNLLKDWSPFLKFFFTFLFSLSLFTFMGMVFISGKLNKILTEVPLPDAFSSLPKSHINFAEHVDLESAKALSKSTVSANKINLYIFFKEALKSNRASFVLSKLGILDEKLRATIEAKKEVNDQEFKRICFHAMKNAVSLNNFRIFLPNILYGIFEAIPEYKGVLFDKKIELSDFANVVFWERMIFVRNQFKKKFWDVETWSSTGGVGKYWAAGYTINLDRFGMDLTKLFAGGKSISIVERGEVMDAIKTILTRSDKNNVILVGDPGVGRTSLVYGFARKVFFGQVPPVLSHRRVIQLDVGKLLAGVSSEGELQERLLGVLDDAIAAGNVILFIDDIHTFLGGCKVGTVDASEVIIPYLTKSGLRVIGTTTYKDWHSCVESNPSLAANFDRVEVKEPTFDETIRILEDVAPNFEKENGMIVTYSAIKEVVRLSDRYISTKAFPAKAIDLLDEACVLCSEKKERYLNVEIVAEVVSKKTNIPVGEAKAEEKEKLLNLEGFLHKRIVDQEEGVKAVSNAMRRVRAGLKDRKKPVGTFLFLGPTGVGKTELSKSLAEAYFGKEETMIRLDMSEYQEVKSIGRIIGEDAGEGTKAGGILTQKIKEKPFSLVLLDEIEKAHPDVLNLFLQVLDEGHLTDSAGRGCDFTHSIIIATSNAGAEIIRDKVKKGIDLDRVKEELLDNLIEKGVFRPEFLNRFDGIIIFKPLTGEHLIRIAGLMINKVKANLAEKGIDLEVIPEALKKLSELGYDPVLGARPMQRVIQDKVENVLAAKILSDEIKRGDKVVLGPENIV